MRSAVDDPFLLRCVRGSVVVRLVLIHYRGGGGGGPFRFRYLWAHRKYLHVPTYVLPRYTSHARANESKIHAGKG